MTQRDIIRAILRDLELPSPEWALAGSGVMFLHGIEREKPLGDLDIFVSTRLWFELYEARRPDGGRRWDLWLPESTDPTCRCDPAYLVRDMHGVEVNVFSSWRQRGPGDIDLNLWVHNAREVDGWPCVPISLLMDWKATMGRAKDLSDIRQIAAFLEAAG